MLILIIEDDNGLAELLAESIEDLGYKSHWTDNFKNAEEYLSNNSPDLMIVDYIVYSKNALDWIDDLKKQPVSIPPFIISTGYGDERIAVNFMKLGARDYIIKDNLFFERLPEIIKRVIKQIDNEEKLKKSEQALKDSEKLLKSVLQSQRELICRFKPDTTLTFVNDTYCKFFDKRYDQLIGTKWTKHFSTDYKEKIIKNLEKLDKGQKKTISHEHDVVASDRTIKWFEWNYYPIKNKDGKTTEFQSVGYDITDRKERERLEKEMEIAKNTLEFKQNFLASMSHEIRTPLTGIMGIAELLEKTSLSKTQKDFVNTLIQASDNLREIIDQVLDYSKIEAGKVELKKKIFHIDNLITKSQKFFKGICRKKITIKTKLDKSLPVLIEADDKRIFQIINNLLINSVKYSEKGEIHLNILRDKSIGDNELLIKIEVTDTGIGIKPERQETIFSPFSQVHEIETENYKGIGLGLAICKEIVELHEGEIGLDSIPGKGTTVWFTFKAGIPGAKLSGDVKQGKIDKKKLPKNLNILFVEDKAVTQKIIKLQLNALGYNVTTANNGKEAIKKFKPGVFDLILMDIQMPVMDGITATKNLKKKYENTPPIVGLSANAFEGDREKYIAQGMDEYLTKPLKIDSFAEVLEKLL